MIPQEIPRKTLNLVQIFLDTKATNLNENFVVLYPIHAVLLKSSLYHRRFIIEIGYKLVGFLPAGKTDSMIVEEVIPGRDEELEK